MTTEFIISKAEMTRRKKAFATLAISLVIGLILTSTKFIIANPWFSMTTLFIFALFLTISSILTFKFLDSVLKIHIYLNDQYLQRNSGEKLEEFLLKDIQNIYIKRTTAKTIRRISIVFTNNTTILINGLENFEQFKEDLINRVGKDIVLEESCEPIDFDHPLFYVILGLLGGFIGVKTLKFIVALDYRNIRFIFSIVYLYVVIVGIYFVIQKPTSKEYGKKAQLIDYILGLLMVCTGVTMLLWGR